MDEGDADQIEFMQIGLLVSTPDGVRVVKIFIPFKWHLKYATFRILYHPFSELSHDVINRNF
jgi:hypothetical protein